MGKAPESMKHPETGVTLYRAVRSVAVFYGETSETADLPGWFPEDPALVDMGVLTPADCKFYDRIFNKLEAQAEGFLSPRRGSADPAPAETWRQARHTGDGR